MPTQVKMSLLSELYLGVIIGLCWSLKSLLSTLPCNKVQFFFSAVALYYMIGGLSYGKLKLFVGLLTYICCHHSDRVINAVWGPMSAMATTVVEAATSTFTESGNYKPATPTRWTGFDLSGSRR